MVFVTKYRKKIINTEILTFIKSGKLPSIIEVRSQARGLVADISSNEAVNQGK
jgi:hypothetical protein